MSVSVSTKRKTHPIRVLPPGIAQSGVISLPFSSPQSLDSPESRLENIEIAEFPERHFWHGGYDKAFPVSLRASLEVNGASHAGTLNDISRGGARFVSGDAVALAAGDIAYLSAQGLSRACVKVVMQRQDVVHLALAAQSEAERDAIGTAIDRLVPGSVRAA